MSDIPVLKRLLLIGDAYLPFTDLDLCHPGTDTPVSRLCLIGPNGIGKTRILQHLSTLFRACPPLTQDDSEGFSLAKYTSGNSEFYLAQAFATQERYFFHCDIERTDLWKTLPTQSPSFIELLGYWTEFILHNPPAFPAEGEHFCFGENNWHNTVQLDTDFPGFLNAALRRREEGFHRFLRDPENRDKTVAEVEGDFERQSPDALLKLRAAWSKLLAPMGIRVDFGVPEGPLRTATNADASPQLSPKIQEMLWRVGLLVYAESSVLGSTLSCDTPEADLHPRIAAEYLSCLQASLGDQGRLFIATHSPLLAATFSPDEHRRLELDSAGTLRAQPCKGRNHEEILLRDFGLGSVPVPSSPGKNSLRQSHRLRRAIRESENEDELADLIDEMISLRNQ